MLKCYETHYAVCRKVITKREKVCWKVITRKIRVLCISEADEKGYELKVEDLTIYNEQPCRLVTLQYTVVMPVFHLFGENFHKQGVIEGYAR